MKPLGGEVLGSGNGMSRCVILNAEFLGNCLLRAPPLGLMVWQLYIQHLAAHPTGELPFDLWILKITLLAKTLFKTSPYNELLNCYSFIDEDPARWAPVTWMLTEQVAPIPWPLWRSHDHRVRELKGLETCWATPLSGQTEAQRGNPREVHGFRQWLMKQLVCSVGTHTPVGLFPSCVLFPIFLISLF